MKIKRKPPSLVVATVEHGVPLMRSKWVHRTWATKEALKAKAQDWQMGPPSAPQLPDARGIDNQGKGPGDPRPGSRHGGPGDPDARQEARLTPGNQPPTREEDKLASPGWNLLEDLGTKKMEAPRGAEAEKLSVSVRPPWKRWATSPTPSQMNTWTRVGHVAS